MTPLRYGLVAVPLALVLAACGGGSSTTESSAAPAPSSSSAAPSASATDLANLPPECLKPITAVSLWYLDQAGVAMALVSSGEITPEVKTGMAELATTFDGYATDIEGGSTDPAYAAIAAGLRQEAETLRTWPDSNTTTDGLAEALDATTSSTDFSDAFQAVIADLESRCSPWRFG